MLHRLCQMSAVDPLQMAAATYVTEKWDEDDWRRFGRETGTSDLISSHPRLYRSLSFGDDDYPDAAFEVMGRILREGADPGTGERGRMELLGDDMPDLPEWIEAQAPPRTRRLFAAYLDSRDASELPERWKKEGGSQVTEFKLENSSSNLNETPPAFPELTWDWSGTSTNLNPPPSSPPEWETPTVHNPSSNTDNHSANEVATHSTGGTRAPQAEHLGSAAKKVFIVHGHDESALNSIRIFVHRVSGIMPISLAEEASRGQTVIEKFEQIGGASSFVIVLLTQDDLGQSVTSAHAGNSPVHRARQNVVLELGYFIGKIGRSNIVVMSADVERPSDVSGLVYIKYPGENWMEGLRREMGASGIPLVP